MASVQQSRDGGQASRSHDPASNRGAFATFIVQHGYATDSKNPRQALAMHKTKKIASWAKGKG